MAVPPVIKAVLSGGGHSDADAVDTGITVAATSTATPTDTLIRVAVRRRFLTRRAIGLKPDICGSSRRPRCTYRAEFCCLLAVPASAHRRRVSRDPVAAQEFPDRCQPVSRCLPGKAFRSRSGCRGKPVAQFRGPDRVGRADDIRRYYRPHLKGHRQVSRGHPPDARRGSRG